MDIRERQLVSRDDLLREGATPATGKIPEMTDIRSGHQVLDVASETGEPAISAK